MLKNELLFIAIKHDVKYAYDDVSEAALSMDLIKDARKLEIEYIRKIKVWTKDPKSQAAGRNIINLKVARR